MYAYLAVAEASLFAAGAAYSSCYSFAASPEERSNRGICLENSNFVLSSEDTNNDLASG